MVHPSGKCPGFDLCCTTAQTWRVALCADHAGICGGQCGPGGSLAVPLSFRCATRTTEGNDKLQPRLDLY